MQRKLGICSDCLKEVLIQNKTKNLCQSCVFKRNHGGKSQARILREKMRFKQAKLKIIRKYRNTGELQVFIEIWQERLHICEHCGIYLGEDAKVNYFSHIKPKSTYPELRLEKSNIELLCEDCHHAREFQGREVYERRKAG